MSDTGTKQWSGSLYAATAHEFRSAWRGAVQGMLRSELQQRLIELAEQARNSATIHQEQLFLQAADSVLPLPQARLERLQEVMKNLQKDTLQGISGRSGNHHIDLLRRFLIITAATPQQPERALAIVRLTRFLLQAEEACVGRELTDLPRSDRMYLASLARLVSRQEIPVAEREHLRQWAERLSTSLLPLSQ